MKPLLLSTNDIEGGAARAAYRLHQSLQAIDIPSRMLVQNKRSSSASVIAQKSAVGKVAERLNDLPLRFYPQRLRSHFSAQWFPDPIAAKVARLNPDLLSVHWICNGYLQIETLAKLKKPLVWTLHDMWAFTGGCHYVQGCDRYTANCGACPQLKSNQNWDASRWIWQRKAATYQNLDLTLVSPSHWLADCAQKSALLQDFRIEVIPHGLDLEVFKPIETQVARRLLNLPQDKQLVLFGAGSNAVDDPRKGLQLLQAALKHLSQTEGGDRFELVIFGTSAPETSLDLGFRANYLGRFYDDIALSLIYAAADVMVVPSVEEAFGQTASEALACGTPVAAFGATGLKDIVDHQLNGYLAQPFAVDDLAQGIAWILADRDRHHQLRERSREKAEKEYSLKLQAERYAALFTDVLAAKS
jgi:glycosyltransferase involved in cell wall biosynthesis